MTDPSGCAKTLALPAGFDAPRRDYEIKLACGEATAEQGAPRKPSAGLEPATAS
jgi:hypothetical protein